tara:strand:- start:7769 stop:8440 length:672 start_codon:yes stop_codon:yes gene_type:complete
MSLWIIPSPESCATANGPQVVRKELVGAEIFVNSKHRLELPINLVHSQSEDWKIDMWIWQFHMVVLATTVICLVKLIIREPQVEFCFSGIRSDVPLVMGNRFGRILQQILGRYFRVERLPKNARARSLVFSVSRILMVRITGASWVTVRGSNMSPRARAYSKSARDTSPLFHPPAPQHALSRICIAFSSVVLAVYREMVRGASVKGRKDFYASSSQHSIEGES